MSTETLARVLGYGGLMPFAVCLAALAVDVPAAAVAASAIIAYGAVILSFVGAVHWGLALTDAGAEHRRLIAFSVVPALVAWASLLLTTTAGLILLLLGFVAVYLYERQLLWPDGLPGWYRTLRMHLTVAVVAMLAAAAGFVAAAG